MPCAYVLFIAGPEGTEKMISTQDQLADMSRDLESRSRAKLILESGFLWLILLFLFVGNFITLLVMLLNRRMRTIPNMFVASLALSDLLIGVLGAGPSVLPVLVTSSDPFNDTFCQFQGYIAITLAVASIHTLVLMAVNRYYRIVQPAKYRRYFTKKKTTIMILVSWLSSLSAPLPYFLSGHKMVFHPFKLFCVPKIIAVVGISGTVCLGISCAIILYCYFRIFKTVRHHNNNFRLPGNPVNTINVEEVKVARTLFITVVFFNLCWAPVMVIDLVDTINEKWIFPREAYLAYSFLAVFSSALNPLIYGVLNKSFRKDYLKVLCCRHCRSQGVVEPLALQGIVSVVGKEPLRNNIQVESDYSII